MAIQFLGNKGEWSEVYVLLKIAADGRLSSKVGSEDTSYHVVKLVRGESSGEKGYAICGEEVEVQINGTNIRKVGRSEIKKVSKYLLEKIKTLSSKKKLEDSMVSELLKKLECDQLKAKSSSKSDIKIVIHDHLTGLQPELGFSVKSKVGSDSTILNAGQTTMFKYQLKGPVDSDLLEKLEALHHFNSKNQKAYEVRDILALLDDRGVGLKFESMVHPIAEGNFIKMDSALPDIFAHFLQCWFKGGIKNIPDLCEKIDQENPCDFPTSVPDMYEFKVKKFLAEVALGMTPGTPWRGVYDATGGFIIIEEDGEIVCFHLVNRNLLENYLFSNTYLDTPSSAKFASYGGVYEEKGGYMLNLCLQIRFKDRLKL